MPRCFIAIEAHTPKLEKYVREAHDVLSRFRVKFSPVDPKITHITLKFLGEISEELVGRVSEKIGGLDFKPFEFKACNIGFFPNQRRPRVVYVGVEKGKSKVVELARKVEERMVRLGFPPERRKFEPHITIARIKFSYPKPPIKDLVDLGRRISELVRVKELKLKKSTLTPQGPIYSDIYVKVFEEA